MKTRAAVLRGVGVDWDVADIELDPPRACEVLEWFPMLGGHEGSGSTSSTTSTKR
jgi:hypothetical protein